MSSIVNLLLMSDQDYVDSETEDDILEHTQQVSLGSMSESELVTNDRSVIRHNNETWSLAATEADMSSKQRENYRHGHFMANLAHVVQSIMNAPNDDALLAVFKDDLVHVKVRTSPSPIPFLKSMLFGEGVGDESIERLLNALSKLDVPHQALVRYIESTCADADVETNSKPVCCLRHGEHKETYFQVDDLKHVFGALQIGELIAHTLTEAQFSARWFCIRQWLTQLLRNHIGSFTNIDHSSPFFPHLYDVLSEIFEFAILSRGDGSPTSPHYSDKWRSDVYTLIVRDICNSCAGYLFYDNLSTEWMDRISNVNGLVYTPLFMHPLHTMCRIHFFYSLFGKITAVEWLKRKVLLPASSSHLQMARGLPPNFCISIASSDLGTCESVTSNKTKVVEETQLTLNVHDWIMTQWPFFKRMLVSQSPEMQTRHLQLPSNFPVAVLGAIVSMCYHGGREDLTAEQAFIEQCAEEYELVDFLMLKCHAIPVCDTIASTFWPDPRSVLSFSHDASNLE